MSDRMTSCSPREDRTQAGIAEWGYVDRAEMIQRFRGHYRRQVEDALTMLALRDDELIVETYVGVHVQRNVREVLS